MKNHLIYPGFLKGRSTEITDKRFQKLKIGYVKIPFPEEIVAGWMKDLVYLPDFTLDCLKSYSKKSVAEKGVKEGENVQLTNHVRSVEHNNISELHKVLFY